ncbi:vesicle transport through interaction with t-SNAREs homolog 1B-like [Mizuhopecten yessoensis]|uniref:Vesicle transport through interaction with t-SNAREs-like 1B n=1 Tax=Mizuhopecten yessoensis TaxID=6573 RepID=A0A210PQ34_MIZYE|nr:vesicle transport through interaction with t-SNAREs homolog 1B-like [Mizuhopecten yessoensis]OWF38610.1 Vesicle transport through interaction with t-SNAREs-like 1B [Mizuhopecten yessoensis]
MSSEKFESLEDDLTSIIDGLRERIEKKIPVYRGEEKKTAIRHAGRNLEEAEFVLQEMEEEAKVAPVPYRTQMLGKLRNYRRDLEQASKLLKKESGKPVGGSDNYGFDRDDRIVASQRSKLMHGTQSLNRASESLARTQQVAAETDMIGVDTIDELGRQRESLVRTKGMLDETDGNLSKSRKILKSMATRVMTNKMILIVIILLELALLGGLVYWKFFS